MDHIKNWLPNLEISPLPQDASSRKYYRVYDNNNNSYILCDSSKEPKSMENFIKIGQVLSKHDLSVPKIFDVKDSMILMEDFGDIKLSQVLYKEAVDAIIQVQSIDHNLSIYGKTMMKDKMSDFLDFYVINSDKEGFYEVWEALFELISDEKVFCLRDYHADNILCLNDRKGYRKIGILDFQDASLAHPAYDVLSLLEDARTLVEKDLRSKMLAYYIAQKNLNRKDFMLSYTILAAQRHMRVLGLFAKRRKKYLSYIPNILKYLSENFEHPMLLDLKKWFEKKCHKIS